MLFSNFFFFFPSLYVNVYCVLIMMPDIKSQALSVAPAMDRQDTLPHPHSTREEPTVLFPTPRPSHSTSEGPTGYVCQPPNTFPRLELNFAKDTFKPGMGSSPADVAPEQFEKLFASLCKYHEQCGETAP